MPWGEHPQRVENLRGIFRKDDRTIRTTSDGVGDCTKNWNPHDIAANSFFVLSVSSAVKFAENSVKAVWETADDKGTPL
jgi:hypothetical protein